jgi:hypothetical protein
LEHVTAFPSFLKLFIVLNNLLSSEGLRAARLPTLPGLYPKSVVKRAL